MKYRREIDGLRAVAVLPVILFHAGFDAFSGGFVGVDIFFVISGYLITTIILADKEKGTFSLVKFYERRARRILPVLFFTMLCCLPFAWLWLTPDHFKIFSESLVAVSSFASNILFWLVDGYFSPAAELIPLLHTWSLAVEEQYYLLFPLFLMLMWKLGKRWIFGSLIVIAISSLWLAQWGAYNEPSATFYLLPTRGWELAIGALIAFNFLYKKNHADLVASNKAVSEALGVLGMALICYSIFSFDKTTPFPSFYALIPTIGTGLIIVFTTPHTLVGRLLGTKTMVGIGLISYSTYLWHQPLFVFARHRSLTELNITSLLSLSLLSILLGYLSWRYIEIPFRNKETFSRNSILYFAAIGSITFISAGLSGYYSNGFKMRQTPSSSLPNNYLSKTVGPHPNRGVDGEKCVSDQANMCLFYKTGSDKNYLLVGDSHSADYSSAFASYVRGENANGWQMSVGGCGMIQGGYETKNGDCGKAVALVKKAVKERRYDKLFIVTNLIAHTRNLPTDARVTGINSFIQLIEEISSEVREVIIFLPRYELDNENPIKYAMLGALKKVHVREEDRDNARAWERAIYDMGLLDNILIFNERDELINAGCGKLGCFDGHDREKYALYRDSNHLTVYGAQLMWNTYYLQFEPN